MKTYDIQNKKIFIAGHNGMVGQAVCRRLNHENCEILTASRSELDLTNQAAVNAWFADNKPDAIILCAARVGGLVANSTYPADFIYTNLMIEANIIHAAYKASVEKLLFLGSSCIYPRDCPQPIKEEYLLSGPLEGTNEWYALAKIAGIKLCQAYRKQHGCDFISAMPTNLYGPGDNFHPENNHVPAGFLMRFHDAKMTHKPNVEIWGTGTTRREFLYVNDLADGLVFLLKNYSEDQHINIGTGEDIEINEFARLVTGAVGYQGKLTHDLSRPDGTPVKVMDVSRINDLGWSATTSLEEGLKTYYEWFLENQEDLRAA